LATPQSKFMLLICSQTLATRIVNTAKGHMRVSVFCGMSVDGFLARPDDTFDFLEAGEGGPHGFSQFFNTVDVVVIGRRTFDVVRNLGHFGLYGKKQIVVLSSRPLDLSSIKARIEKMSGTPQEIVSQLVKRRFKHAYVDGGITIQQFLAAGLVDRITVTRVPVLIGRGIPLFGPLPHDIHLRHLATRSYKGGLVQSKYQAERLKPRRAPSKQRPVRPGKRMRTE
jgi:dihydrofolate reductase